MKFLIAFFLVLLCFSPLFAQTWTLNLILSPTPSPYVIDWQTDPTIAQLEIFYQGNQPIQVQIHMQTIAAGFGEMGRGTSKILDIPTGPYTEIVTTPYIIDWHEAQYEDVMEETIIRTGRLPEDEYEVYISLRDLEGNILAEISQPFSIYLPDPPQLIEPYDQTIIPISYPTFQWTGVNVSASFDVVYHLKIVELLQGQEPQRALEANYIHHEAYITDAISYQYPMDALPFEENRVYVWQVQALDTPGGVAVAGNEGLSEIWSFSYQEIGDDPFSMQEIVLIPQFAKLVELDGLDQTLEGGTLQLNGFCRLALTFPGFTEQLIMVELEDVQLFSDDLGDPTILEGRVEGELLPGTLPQSITGSYLNLTTVRYDPVSGLKVDGELSIVDAGDSKTISLDSPLTLDQTGLNGSVEIAGSLSNPIFRLGQGAVQLLVTFIHMNLPAPDLYMSATLSLFEQNSLTEFTDIRLSGAGELDLHIDQLTQLNFPLEGSNNHILLTIPELSGDFYYNFQSGICSYNLHANAGLSMDFNHLEHIQATTDLELTSQGTFLSNFNAQLDIANRVLDMDWLTLEILRLQASYIEYTPETGWDFEFLLDMDLHLKGLPDWDLPFISDIKLTSSGFQFPDIHLPTLPDFNWEFFQIHPFNLHLPSFTFNWFQSNGSSSAFASQFDFNFDFNFSLLDPNAAFPQCLRRPDMKVENATISDGMFSAALTTTLIEPPGCSIYFGDIYFTIYELSGQLGGDLSVVDQRYDNHLYIKGHLGIPSAFSCSAEQEIELMHAELTLTHNGIIEGEILNMPQFCPLNLASMSLELSSVGLRFFNDNGSQGIVLNAEASVSLKNGNNQTITAEGDLEYDLIHNQLLSGDLAINQPFWWHLPSESAPVLSFLLPSAQLDENGLLIDGTAELKLADISINARFENAVMGFENGELKSGSVRFDSPFALAIEYTDDGLQMHAVASGTPLSTGIILEFPSDISLQPEGLTVETLQSSALLYYKETPYSGLQTQFSPDFALPLHDFEMIGQVDFYQGDAHLGHVDRYGFHPDPSFFEGFIPPILALPNKAIAYLELREGGDETGTLRIDQPVQEGNLVHITGEGVRLVIPALTFGRSQTPELAVDFGLTLDKSWTEVIDGGFDCEIPGDKKDAFDLTSIGIPFKIDALSYSSIAQAGAPLNFSGTIVLFERESGRIRLNLGPNGDLSGDFNVDMEQDIPLVPESEALVLHLNKAFGNFNLGQSRPVDYTITADAGLSMQFQQESDPCQFSTTVVKTPTDTRFESISVATCGVENRKINLGILEIHIHDLSIDYFAYRESTQDFDFDGTADIDVNWLGLSNRLDVNFGRSGFTFPNINFKCPLDCEINLGLFILKDCNIILKDFTWPFGTLFSSKGGDGGGTVWPKLPDLIPQCLKQASLNLNNFQFSDNKISADIPAKLIAEPGCPIDFGAGIVLHVQELSGQVDVAAGLDGIEHDDSLFVKGKLEVSNLFSCEGGGQKLDLLNTKLAINSDGLIDGEVKNIVPTCPLSFGAVGLDLDKADIIFHHENTRQEIDLSTSGAVEVNIKPDSKISAEGSLDIDLTTGRITDGSLQLTEAFTWALPSENPVMQFTINHAGLDKEGLCLDGSNQLNLGDQQAINVSFDEFTLDLETFAVQKGRVDFNAPFAFTLGVDKQSHNVEWGCVPSGSSLNGQNGILLDLPLTQEQFSFYLDQSGLHFSGQASAQFRWEETEFDIDAVFSDDFLINPSAFSVSSGRVEFYSGIDRIAWIDAGGFSLDPDFLPNLLPEKIPLPNATIAYLLLRNDAGELNVETSSDGDVMQIWTPEGHSIELVLPVLEAMNGSAPALMLSIRHPGIGFNLKTMSVISGDIALEVAGMPVFNFTQHGLPFMATKLQYDLVNTCLALEGDIRLFDHTLGSTSLSISASGVLQGEIDLSPEFEIPLVPGSENVLLKLSDISGHFAANLLAFSDLDFELTAGTDLNFYFNEAHPLHAEYDMTATNDGIAFTAIADADAVLQSDYPLDLGSLQLYFSDFDINHFSYSLANGEFDFSVTTGLQFNFPALFKDNEINATIESINIDKSGIRIDETTISFQDMDPFDFLGFRVQPQNFRISDVDYNWFAGDVPDLSQWGLSFDLRIFLPEFATESYLAPLSGLNIDILALGYDGGVMTGSMEPLTLADPVALPLANAMNLNINALAGEFLNLDGQQAVEINLTGEFEGGELFSGFEGNPDFNLVVSSAGTIRGDISLQSGSIDLSPLSISLKNALLDFDLSASRQEAVVSMEMATATLTYGENQSVSGTGEDIEFDLVSLELLQGSFSIDGDFTWSFPQDDPALTFILSSAEINTRGITFSGSSALQLEEGKTAELEFEEFTLSLADFSVSGGSAEFAQSFGFNLALDGDFDWKPKSPEFSSYLQTGVFLLLPEISMNRDGLVISGTSTVTLRWQGKEYASVTSVFQNDAAGKPFTLGYSPLQINSGVVEFKWTNDTGEEISLGMLDRDGFHPGDILEVLDIPPTLALGNPEIAEIWLRQGGIENGELLIETEYEEGNYSIQTKGGKAVTLRITALGDALGETPEIDVDFKVTVNGSFTEFVSGEIAATVSDGQPNLFALDDLGVPMDVHSILFNKVNGNPHFELGISPRLPAPLSRLQVASTIAISSSGLSGEATFSCGEEAGEACTYNVAGGAVGIRLDGGGVSFVENSITTFNLNGALSCELFESDINIAIAYSESQWDVDTQNDIGDSVEVSLGDFAGLSLTGFDFESSNGTCSFILDGTVNFPDLNNTEITITDLMLSTDPDKPISLGTATVGELQPIDLFGTTLSLTQVDFSVERPTLFATLNGKIDFAGEEVSFANLKIGTDGTIEFDTMIIYEGEIGIISDYAVMNKVTLTSEGSFETLTLGLAGQVQNLPTPFSQKAQSFDISVQADGTVVGESKMTLCKDTARAYDKDASEYDFWQFVFDVYSLDLDLDFADFGNSSLNAVCDIYALEGETECAHIPIGDEGEPGIVINRNGIRVDADFSDVGTLEFNWKAFSLSAALTGIHPDEGKFSCEFRGEMGVDIPAFEGGLTFSSLTVYQSGNPEIDISGGNVGIGDVIDISVSTLAFSPDGLELTDVVLPASEEDVQSAKHQSSNLAFDNFFLAEGATVTIGSDLFSGECRQILFYQSSNETRFLVDSLSITSSAFEADFFLDYRQKGSDFAIYTGGRVKVGEYTATGCGFLESSGSVVSFGFFVKASELHITLFPGIELNTLGGGLFYKVDDNVIKNTRTLAGMDFDPVEGIPDNIGFEEPETSSTSQLVLMFYAGIRVAGSADADVLITISDTYFCLDGKVIVFENNVLQGYCHLTIRFDQNYIVGGVRIEMDLGKIARGGYSVSFWYFGEDRWGIYGDAHFVLFELVTVDGMMFIGPPGFVTEVNAHFELPDIKIIELKIKSTLWLWYNSESGGWGAYSCTSAKCCTIWDLACIKGSIEILIMGGDGDLYIGGCGTLRACVNCVLKKCCSPRVSAWITFRNGQWNAGVGGKGGFDDDLEKAKKEKDDILAAAEEAQEEMEAAEEEARTFNEEELAQAFQNLQQKYSKLGPSAFNDIIFETYHNHGGLKWPEDDVHEWIIDEIWSKLSPIHNFETDISGGDSDSSPSAGQSNTSETGNYSGPGGQNNNAPDVSSMPESLKELLARWGSVDNLFKVRIYNIFHKALQDARSARSSAEQSVAKSVSTAHNFFQQLSSFGFDIHEFEEATSEYEPVSPITVTWPEQSPITISQDGDTSLVDQPSFTVDDKLYDKLYDYVQETQRDVADAENELAVFIQNLYEKLQSLDAILFNQEGKVSISDVGKDFQTASDNLAVFHQLYYDLVLITMRWAEKQKKMLAEQEEWILSDFLDHKNNRMMNDPVMGIDQFKNLAKARKNFICDYVPESVYASSTFAEQVDATTDISETAMLAKTAGKELYYDMALAAFDYIKHEADGIAAQKIVIIAEDNQRHLDKIHQSYSVGLDRVLESKMRFTEILYDLTDYYLSVYAEPGDVSPALDSDANFSGQTQVAVESDSPDIMFMKDLLKELEEQFTAPDINGINVDINYQDNQIGIEADWTATHTIGISDFSYRIKPRFLPLAGRYPRILNTDYLSLGLYQPMKRYLVRGSTGQSGRDDSYLLRVRARSRTGYAVERSADFTIHFSAAGWGRSETEPQNHFEMNDDETPPSVPIVVFPDRAITEAPIPSPEIDLYTEDIAMVTRVVFHNSCTILRVGWEASDDESSVTEYIYCLNTRAIEEGEPFEWKSAQARNEIFLTDLNLDPDQIYYVHVKARNAVGLWSAVGTSCPILIDLSPPIAVSNLQYSAKERCSRLSDPDAVPVTGDERALSINAVTDVSTTFNTTLSNSQDDLNVQNSITASSDTDFNIPAADDMVLKSVESIINNADLSEFYKNSCACGNTGAEVYSPNRYYYPTIRLEFDAARDEESNIRTYRMLVSSTPIAEYSVLLPWVELGVQNKAVDHLRFLLQSSYVEGDTLLKIYNKNNNAVLNDEYTVVNTCDYPLRYKKACYITIVPMNYAGSPGPMQSVGPVILHDPSRPQRPEIKINSSYRCGNICYLPKEHASVKVSNISDLESGIDTTSLMLAGFSSDESILNFENLNWQSIETGFSEPEYDISYTFELGTNYLTQGYIYFLAAYTQSLDGCISPKSRFLALCIDKTPPPTPEVGEIKVWGNSGNLMINVSVDIDNVFDQESGLSDLVYIVLPIDGDDTNMSLVSSDRIDLSNWYGNYKSIVFSLPKTTADYCLSVRTTNRAGLKSDIIFTTFHVESEHTQYLVEKSYLSPEELKDSDVIQGVINTISQQSYQYEDFTNEYTAPMP